MSFLKKFKNKRKSSETGSLGSTSSLKSVGVFKSSILIPYSVNEKDLPPFLKAIWKNDLNKVRKLIKKNSNVVDGEGRTGLHLASATGNEEMVRELLEGSTMDLKEKRDVMGRTSIFKAVEAGAVTCVKLLIDSGARMDISDSLGDSLLHSAVRHKYDDIVAYLLEKGCQHSELNKEGFTPLHLAASINYDLAIDMLLDHGIDVDQLSSSGKSALILASESGNYNTIKVLLVKSADYKIIDNDGKDAYYYADFHQYNNCAQQLRSLSNYNQNKTPPKRPSPIQMPEFVAVALGASTAEYQETTPKSHLESILRNHTSKNISPTKDREGIKSQNINDRISITSENSWSGDISYYSSDTTLPINKINPLHDISTPSSMPNPSEDTFNPLKSLTNGVSKTQLNKHIFDDEESQWTDTDEINEHKLNVESQPKNEFVNKIVTENKMDFVEAVKNSDSDWDSDTDLGKYEVEDNLSTIDEESGGKQDLKMPKSVDGHQTDSNIEECFNVNSLILNKPVRYDSCETLENSYDYEEEDTELSQTKIPNPNYMERSLTPTSKPPMTKGESIPTIRVEDTEKRIRWANNASGDNLSYTSTEHSSKPESVVGSEKIADYDKSNPQLIGEYIKKCSSMESKLRIVESEKTILEQKIKHIEESKKKLETEKSKLQKDYQKLEVMFSEQKDGLDEFKSRFIISEELLKTREKELFESKKLNQDLVGSRNEIEMKNITYNSKINQLTQEISDLQLELQRSNNCGNVEDNYSVHETLLEKSMEHLKHKLMTSDKDAENYKTQYENERLMLQEKHDELNNQLIELQKELDKLKLVSESKILEQKCNIELKEDQIKELTHNVEETKEDNMNKDEEIEELKKTIKNLNTDLESSNKFATMSAKEEQKNKILSEQLKIEEDKVDKMCKENQIWINQVSESAKDHRNVSSELERLRNQLILKDETCSKLELKSKTFEKQSKDFEQLIEVRMRDLKELNLKCTELQESLISEKNKKDNILEELNVAINSALNLCPNSEEVLENLENMRKLINGYYTKHSNKAFQPSTSYHEIDSSIELTKARSQLRVLQDQLDNVRRDFRRSQDEIDATNRVEFEDGYEKLRSLSNILTQFDHMSKLFTTEMNRVDKIERIEKENQQLFNDQTMSLRKSQQEEKQKIQQIQENEKFLSNQLSNAMKSNQSMADMQEALKQILIKYYKKFEDEDKVMSSFMGSSSLSSDIDNIDVMMFCSRLLQKLTNIIDEIKMKLKKVELEKLQLEEQQITRDKNKDIVIANSKMIVTQQLSELTQIMDNQRNNREKLEKIRDDNEFHLRNELYELKQTTSMEISNINQALSCVQKEREELLQEVRDLREQLFKERNLKDSLTEQLVNIIKNPNGSTSQIYGCKEIIFPSTTAINTNSSQWNIPYNISEVDRKPFSTSMSNLSMLRVSGIEDDEMRQRMRNELDRSIAKHLESGRPIRQLNVKDKIRSLNIVKFPYTNIAWKA